MLPISTINNIKQEGNNVVEPILLYDITYEIKTIEEIETTPTPTPDPYEVAMQNMQTEMDKIELIEDRREWFVAYKDIVFKYAKWIDPPNTIFDYLTEDEVRLICKTVETECYQQNFDSKCNVASTIFNRIKIGGEFGNSVTEVITKENQFAYGRETITEDTILAVMYSWEIEDVTNGCVGFRSGELPKTWHDWELQFVDQAGHGFYK